MARALVAERKVARLAVARGKRNADDSGTHRERLAGNHAKRELAGRAQLADQPSSAASDVTSV